MHTKSRTRWGSSPNRRGRARRTQPAAAGQTCRGRGLSHLTAPLTGDAGARTGSQERGAPACPDRCCGTTTRSRLMQGPSGATAHAEARQPSMAAVRHWDAEMTRERSPRQHAPQDPPPTEPERPAGTHVQPPCQPLTRSPTPINADTARRVQESPLGRHDSASSHGAEEVRHGPWTTSSPQHAAHERHDGQPKHMQAKCPKSRNVSRHIKCARKQAMHNNAPGVTGTQRWGGKPQYSKFSQQLPQAQSAGGAQQHRRLLGPTPPTARRPRGTTTITNGTLTGIRDRPRTLVDRHRRQDTVQIGQKSLSSRS